MYKKFLRTSVLTLVLGVFHMNEIHAMETRYDLDGYQAEAKRQHAITTFETEECLDRLRSKGETLLSGNILHAWKSLRTSVEHLRIMIPTEDDGNDQTQSRTNDNSYCRGCHTLIELELKSLKKANRYARNLYNTQRIEKRSIVRPPSRRYSGSTSYQPSMAAALPEPETETAHNAPSPHFASGHGPHSPSYSSSTS